MPPRAALERWLPVAVLVLGLGAWEGAVRLLQVPDLILPAPSAVARSLYFGVASGVFPHHLMITALQAVLGLVLAVGAGLAVGALIAELPLAERVALPFVVAFQAMPKVALAPLVIVWFGYGIGSKVVLAAVIGFFPVLVNVIAGLKSCEGGRLDVLRALSASRWQLFRLVKLPSALPFVLAGVQVAAVLVVLGAVVGEFLGAKEGLGTLILLANGTLDIAQIFAVLAILGGLGITLLALVRAAQRRLLRWAPSEGLHRA